MTSARERAVEAGARAASPHAFNDAFWLSRKAPDHHQKHAQANALKHADAVIRAALLSMAGHLSDVVNCHSDDRPRRDGIDWNDGYQDGCKGAARALRARIQQMAEAL